MFWNRQTKWNNYMTQLANIDVQLCHIIVPFGLLIPKHVKLLILHWEICQYWLKCGNIGKYWRILANIANIGKYWCPIFSYNIRIWYADSKTHQTFDFTLRKTHFIAKKLKGHSFCDTLYLFSGCFESLWSIPKNNFFLGFWHSYHQWHHYCWF